MLKTLSAKQDLLAFDKVYISITDSFSEKNRSCRNTVLKENNKLKQNDTIFLRSYPLRILFQLYPFKTNRTKVKSRNCVFLEFERKSYFS